MPPRLPLPLPVPILPPPPHNPTPEPIELTFIDTEPNEFGLYRSYPHLPSFEPDEDVSLDSLCDSPAFAVAENSTRPWWSGLGNSFSGVADNISSAVDNIFAPFLNSTTF